MDDFHVDEFLDQVTAEVPKETKTSEFEQLLQYADDEVVEGSRVSSVDEAIVALATNNNNIQVDPSMFPVSPSYPSSIQVVPPTSTRSWYWKI